MSELLLGLYQSGRRWLVECPAKLVAGCRAFLLAYWEMRPRGLWHWLSVVALWSVMAVYWQHWVTGNWSYLTDTALQTDDVRTALFPFHRYGPEGALENDPIALEMLAYIPWLIKAVFWLSVPAVGLFAASKVSQLVCLGIIVFGGVLLMKYRRTGVAAGLLLIFLFLRDTYVIERIASGLPRGYGFPALALWVAGALAGRTNIRRFAIVIAALSYPSALAMALGGEGLLVARGFFQRSRRGMWVAMRRLSVTVLLAVAAVSPALMAGNEADGSVHTLAEAKKEPAFGKRGRLYILPFADSRRVFGKHFSATYSAQGTPPVSVFRNFIKGQGSAVATASIALLLVMALVGLSPAPRVAIAFFASTSIIYVAARFLAFRLYSPERYYSYGMRAAGIILLLNTVVFLGYRFKGRLRYPFRNFVAAGVILSLWFVMGDGIKARNGMVVDARRGAKLYRFVRSLPVDVRIASHPSDGDNIPYFAGRATMGSYETLQPWLKGSWARQKARAQETLRAVYSTDRAEVLSYAKKHGVTHFYLSSKRYGRNYMRESVSFEPLTSFAKKLLVTRKPGRMVLSKPPPASIVYRGRGRVIVSIEKLEEAWNGES